MLLIVFSEHKWPYMWENCPHLPHFSFLALVSCHDFLTFHQNGLYVELKRRKEKMLKKKLKLKMAKNYEKLIFLYFCSAQWYESLPKLTKNVLMCQKWLIYIIRWICPYVHPSVIQVTASLSHIASKITWSFFQMSLV